MAGLATMHSSPQVFAMSMMVTHHYLVISPSRKQVNLHGQLE